MTHAMHFRERRTSNSLVSFATFLNRRTEVIFTRKYVDAYLAGVNFLSLATQIIFRNVIPEITYKYGRPTRSVALDGLFPIRNQELVINVDTKLRDILKIYLGIGDENV